MGYDGLDLAVIRSQSPLRPWAASFANLLSEQSNPQAQFIIPMPIVEEFQNSKGAVTGSLGGQK